MTEQIERALARCDDCSKGYRVPDPDRAFRCPACGGTVRTTEEPAVPHSHLQGAVTCSECQAINHHGAQFCAECGAVLGVSPPLQSSEEATRARREATGALKRGYKWIAGVTWLYRAGALGYAAMMAIAVLALGSTDVPLGAGILVVALSTLLTVVILMGAVQILFNPFVWTVVIASLASLMSVAHLVGPNPLGLAFLWSAAWAALFWAAVGPTLWFRRLIRRHKDLYIMHHASRRTRSSLEGRSASERHERLLKAMQRAGQRAWKISAATGTVVLLTSALGTYAVCANLRPQVLADALEGFETAWNDADLAAVVGFIPSEIRERESVWLAGVADGHGWGDSPPQLDDGLTREGDECVWVDYELDDITMSTCWTMDELQWLLIRIELPVPPLEPAVERLLQAWRSSDPKAIAAFFPAGHQDRMLESIERAVSRRGWDPFPEVLETDMSDYTEGEAIVTLAVESGEVTTGWLFGIEGTWQLKSLRFPKR